MTVPKASYVPPDRLQALVSGTSLPYTAEGSVLFADISGFTPVTERLRVTLGARHGAEQLAVYLNRVYDTLIAEVDRQGGSIIGFAGDAITCWFSGEVSAIQAVTCGFALLEAMSGVERIEVPEGEPLLLGLKVAITTGMTKRFFVGDPDIQLVDVLAGMVVARVATGEALAERGELLADAATVERVADSV
jgi:adenylate cyclase